VVAKGTENPDGTLTVASLEPAPEQK
jgi:hypothetical protein